MPDKKDLFANVPDATQTAPAPAAPATTPEAAKSDLFASVPDVSQNTQPAPAQPANSGKPTSMQAVNQQVPSDSYTQDLQTATSIMSKYLGAGFGTPETGHTVTYAGKTEKGNLAVDTYNAQKGFKRNVLNSKVSNEVQPADNSQIVAPQQIKTQPTDADIDAARPVIKNEVAASSQYIGNFINENQQDLSKYPLYPGQLQGDKMPQAGILSPENISNKVLNQNGDVQTLSNFSTSAFTLLQQKQEKELADLEQRYPLHPGRIINAAAGGEMPAYRENEDKYQQERKQVEDKYQSQREGLFHAVSSLAQLKVANQFINQKGPNANVTDKDFENIGLEYAKAVGMPNADRDMQYSRDNKLTPDDKVAYQRLGGRALQYKMMEAAGNGQDAVAKDISNHVANYQQKILDANPEYVNDKVINVISNKLLDNKKPATPENINEAAKEIGLRPQDYANITPEDIKTNSNVLQDIGKGFHETSAPITEFFIRHIATPFHNFVSVPVNKLTGWGGTDIIDKEDLDKVFDGNWYDNTWLGKHVLGGPNPDAASLFGNPTQVQGNANANDYLMSVANPKAGKFQPSFSNITGTIANGIGQLGGFISGSGEISKALQGAGIVKHAADADKVATAATMYLTGIDNNIKEAEQAIPGTTDEDKLKQTLLGHLYTVADIAGFEVLTPLELKNKIFSPNSATGKELIDIIKNDGIDGLTKRNKLASLFVTGAKEAGVDWAKMTGGATAGQVGRLFADMALAPEKVKNEDVSQELIQNATTMGIINLIPTGFAGLAKAREEGKIRNALPYEVGSNPRPYLDAVQNMVDNGQLDEQTGQQHKQLINTLSNIVEKSVPEQSLVNGQPLSIEQKQEYANNLLQEAIADSHKNTVGDKVQIQQIDDYVNNLQQRRLDILNNASDFKEFNKNLFSSPINTGNNEKANTEGAKGNESPQANINQNQGQSPQGNEAGQNGNVLAKNQEGSSGANLNLTNNKFDVSGKAATPSLIAEHAGKNNYGFEEEAITSPRVIKDGKELVNEYGDFTEHAKELADNRIKNASLEELNNISDNVINREKKVLTEAFGEDGYNKYKQLESYVNNKNSSREAALKAEDELNKMHDSLTDKQKSELSLHPEEYYDASEYKDIKKYANAFNPEALHDADERILTSAFGREVSTGNPTDNVKDYIVLKGSYQELKRRGYSDQEIISKAIAEREAQGHSPEHLKELIQNNLQKIKDATQNSQQQNESRNQQGSIGQHSGANEGQPENRQSQGSERQPTQPPADNSNSGERSAQGKKEVASIDHLNKLDELTEAVDKTKTTKVKAKREAELKKYQKQLPENIKQVLDHEDQIVEQLKNQKRLEVEC